VVYGFKRFMLLSVSVVLVGVVLVYGLKAGLPYEKETEGSITVERVFEEWGFKFTMSVEKKEYAYDEPINITCALENIVNETVKVVFTSSGRRFLLAIYNTSDIFNTSKPEPEVIWDSPSIAFAAFDTIVLNVGESITSTIQWRQERFLQGHAVVTHAPPGTYYIFGQTFYVWYVERGSFRSEDLFEFLVIYEPIEVTILPP